MDITNDYEWEKRDTFAFSACYQTAYRQGGNVIRSFDYSPVDLLRILQAEIPNDTDVIKVLFASHIIESKVPRLRYSYNGERKGCFEQTATFQRIGLPDSLVDYKTPYHIIMTEGRDSITGLNSAMTTCYFANTEAGWMRVNLPTSRNFVEASIIELYDISQCYYHLTLNMTRYSSKRSLSLDFGGATEFSHMDPEPDKITMSGIVFTDSLKIDQIGHNGLWMHAKFKQLENIQIIRMFAVTTALGFFIAVLFDSGWKWLARRSRRYIAKEKLKKIAKEQMDKDG